MNKWHIRISVTPECNFRCIYCNPNNLMEEREVLTNDDIINILSAAKANGIERVHWTGGEPSLLDIQYLASKAKLIGMTQQIITTNGSRGGVYAKQIIAAGITRIIVSLDTIDKNLNQIITGRSFIDNTLSFIEQSILQLSSPTKINVVSLKETMEKLPMIIDYASQKNCSKKYSGSLAIKIIELCPNNPVFYDSSGQDLFKNFHVSREQIFHCLNQCGQLEKTSVEGDNPNIEYFSIKPKNVIVGLVTMPSLNYQCGHEKCRKLRVNPYGDSGVCIGMEPINIRGKNAGQIAKEFAKLIAYRNKLECTNPDRKHFRDEYGFWRFGLCEKRV